MLPQNALVYKILNFNWANNRKIVQLILFSRFFSLSVKQFGNGFLKLNFFSRILATMIYV